MFTGSFIDALIVHLTKLFWIDVIIHYKNKTSQGTSIIIIFLFWTLWNSTHGKIFSCWSRKEDLNYSVSKHGNKITKVCAKSRDFLEKKMNKKMKGCCVENIAVFLWMFWKAFNGKTQRKRKDSLQLIWPLVHWHFLQTFIILKLFLPLDWSCICFEDGSLLLMLRSSSHEMLLH